MKWHNENVFAQIAKHARRGLLIAILPLSGIFACGYERAGSRASDRQVAQTADALTTCVTFQRGTYGTVVDATLKDPPMGNNFGSQPTLQVTRRNEALVHFDLSSIDNDVSVQSATLKLYAQGFGSANIKVHRARSSWSEGSVTYASFNQDYDPAIAGILNAQTQNAQKSVELRALVASWINGTNANYGVLLETDDNVATNFKSSDASGSYRPALTVCYKTVDPCDSDPCDHGTCTNVPGDTYSCACNPGYTGTDCDVNIDECLDNPCLNSGNCTDLSPGYSCTCQPGFTGTNCQTNTNDCSPNPCLNGGVCTDGVNSYSCACAPGYTGASCETLIDYCVSNPCQNGSTCSNTGAGYSCSCVSGYSGTNCEVNIDDCSGNPCQNGGICTDGVNSYTCQCQLGWNGATCTTLLNACSPNPCQNGASCTNLLLTYLCSCATGYSGTNCEVNIDDCSPNPCQNGGICQDGVNSYSCLCQFGWSGSTCGTFNCNDNNLCTSDSYSEISGCAFEAVDCDDSNSSTEDSCDPASGCVNNGSPNCDDTNACTTDSYSNGCVHTPVNCDDSNSSTVDSCNPVNGSCIHDSCTTCGMSCVDLQTDEANCGSCSNACGGGLECTAGVCTSPAGNLRVVLTWSTDGDMDLYLTTPTGDTIYYENTGPDSGTDFGTYSQDSYGTGPETIFWENQYTPPGGTYHVCAFWPYDSAVSVEAVVTRPGQPNLVLSGSYSSYATSGQSPCTPSSATYLGSFSVAGVAD